MQELSLTSYSKSDNYSIAQKVLGACENAKVFAFYGELGAGKTTLIKSLCEVLGVEESVNSPTFTLVNTYSSIKGSVYHFDFYRIKSLEEAYDLGYEEYFDSDGFCFIEWPEKIEALLPEDSVKVRLSVNIEDESRHILVNY